jgi:hypothetical protein
MAPTVQASSRVQFATGSLIAVVGRVVLNMGISNNLCDFTTAIGNGKNEVI